MGGGKGKGKRAITGKKRKPRKRTLFGRGKRRKQTGKKRKPRKQRGGRKPGKKRTGKKRNITKASLEDIFS